MSGLGELKSNFTFKFPAKTGFFYHVPNYSPVNTIMPAIWDTKHRGGNIFKLHTNCVMTLYESDPHNLLFL